MTTFFTNPKNARNTTVFVILAIAVAVAFVLNRLAGGNDFSSLNAGGTQALSTQILLSIVAPWYTNFDSTGEVGDSISIVLIDDQAIAEHGGVYPLPYEEQSQLVQRVAFRLTERQDEIKPTALFVDLIYADDRGVRERSKQEHVWLEAFKSMQSERPPLPTRLLPYNITTLGDDIEFAAQEGTQVGVDGAQTARAYPPLATDYAGILVADYMPLGVHPSSDPFASDSIAPAGSPQSLSLYGFVNRLKAPSAPVLFADGPLRYALAPDGILSPAAILALWTCAAKSFIHRPRGCAEGGFLDTQDVFNAAKAAAIADVSKQCSALIERLGDTRAGHDACRQAAFDHAAQAGWAPDVHQNCQGEACTSPINPAIHLLAKYASARRNGHFEGSIKVLKCFDDIDIGLKSRFCSGLERFDDDRIGPMMTVFWGITPRDLYYANSSSSGSHISKGALLSQPPAAPYTWATREDGQPVDDPCEGYRIRSFAERFFVSVKELIPAYSQETGSNPTLCSYHPQLRPSWLYSDNQRTRLFADWSIDERVVMVGVSVAGIEDTHKMRGIQAPGVWAHAMALDNILTFGSDYRRVNFGLGLNPDIPYGLYNPIREALISICISFIFTIMCKKDDIENFIEDRMPRYLHKITSKFVFDVVIGGFGFVMLSLFIAILFFIFTSYPPLDWICVAVLATGQWMVLSEK